MQGAAQAAKASPARKPQAVASEIELLRDISMQLDRVIAVLAAQGKDRDRQIEILSAAGCDSNFVGTVVGMTAAAVRKYQSRQRSKVGIGASAAGGEDQA